MKQQLRKLFNVKNRQEFAYHKYPLNFLKDKPDFIIIGSQKAATTSLHSFLSNHPQLMASTVKETQYYNMNYERGTQYYLSCFPIKKNGVQSFESTPDYLDHPLVPKLLHSSKPDTKLIVTLREPVSRAYSHFSFVQGYNAEEREISFQEGLSLEETRIKEAMDKLHSDPYNSARHLSNYGYRRKGEYAQHIKRWLEYFPLEHFHFMEFSDITSNNEEAYHQLFHFLGVDPIKPKRIIKQNVTDYNSTMDVSTKNELKDYFAPHNEELFELIGQRYQW